MLNYRLYVHIFLIIISYFFIIGCASSIPKADPVLISQYKPPLEINNQETLIFVIRQDTGYGAAYGLWVACNDRYIAELYAGSYTFFKTKAELNTINLRQMKMLISSQKVDFRPGETVFLFFNYNQNSFYEIDKDLGKTMVMKYQKIEDEKNSEKNTDFETGLMNPGLVGLKLMKWTTFDLKPDENHATVTFLRPQYFGAGYPIGIWNQDGFLGDIRDQAQFTVKLKPGKHYFIANSRYYNVIKADLSAGKKYYIVVEAYGWPQMNIRFLPLKANVKSDEIQEWIKQSSSKTECVIQSDSKIQKRIAAARPLISRTIEEVKSGKLDSLSISAADGR